jgi:CheY-like chemotaxis protein
MLNNTPRHNLLMIEDSLADVRLMIEAIKEVGLDNLLTPHYAYNSEEAFALLESSKNIDVTFDLILLDLNMPKVSGKEILSKIKSDDALKNIPVFILSNSDYKTDMIDCYNLKADSYLQKPSDFKRLIDFFSCVKQSLEINKRLSILHVERHYEEMRLAI